MIGRALNSLAFMGLGLSGLFIVPSSAKLLFAAETFEGHLFGLAGFATFAAIAAALLIFRPGVSKDRRKKYVWIAGICLATVFVLATVLAIQARARQSEEPPVAGAPRAMWFRDRPHPSFAFSDLLPEIDQISLGISVAHYLDPLLDAKRADRVRALALPLYREMEAAPEYRALGSAMSFAYGDLFGGDNGAGHAFVYVPAHAENEKLAALIFAHGAAGNFASYIHVWRALADAEHVVIVCPTFGFGDWGRDEGIETLRDALAFTTSKLPVDPRRVFLGGLSQGGAGVTRGVPELASQLRGVVLISAVLDDAALGDARWRDVAVLVIHGEKDERIPRDYTQRGVDRLKHSGANVTLRWFPSEDHFLFYGVRKEALAEIGTFLLSSP